MENTISVIIPSYNYGRFLGEAVDSVLSQTRVPDEIVIIDDGSIDSTLEIAKSYEKAFSAVKVIHNEHNLGIIPTFNKAVAYSSGSLICFLGADNRMSSRYIEMCSKVLESKDDVAIAYTDYILFGELSKEVYERHHSEWQNGYIEKDGLEGYLIRFPEWDDCLSKDLLRKGNFIHGSSMFRKDAFDDVGGYLPSNSFAPEDYGLFLRMIDKGWKAKKVQEDAVLEYRQHSREQANVKAQERAMIEQFDDVIQHWQKDVAELRAEIQLRDEMIANLENKLRTLGIMDFIKIKRNKDIR